MDYVKTMRAESTNAIRRFSENRVLVAIKNGTWTREQYIRLLLMLFHQVHRGTMSFALAASSCPAKWTFLREYLIHHTNEEMRHYEWIVDDLRSVGYTGPHPQDTLPSAEAMAYISFNIHNAQYFPPSRLCSSTVLEGLSVHISAKEILANLLGAGLVEENFSFFLRHSQTDKKHVNELWDVIGRLDLAEPEWDWMIHATRVAGKFYKQIYDASLDSPDQ